MISTNTETSQASWMARASNPRCLSSRAYAYVYQQAHNKAPRPQRLAKSLTDLCVLARTLHVGMAKNNFNPDQGDAIELVYDRETLSLIELQNGQMGRPLPAVATVIRKEFFKPVEGPSATGAVEYRADVESEMQFVTLEVNELTNFVADRVIKKNAAEALQVGQLWEAEYRSIIATPCSLCPDTACKAREACPPLTELGASRQATGQ